MDGQIDIINSTLGKALGGAAGGYTTGPKQLVQLLRQKSRPYLFSNSLPPPVVATATKVSNPLCSQLACDIRTTLSPAEICKLSRVPPARAQAAKSVPRLGLVAGPSRVEAPTLPEQAVP